MRTTFLRSTLTIALAAGLAATASAQQQVNPEEPGFGKDPRVSEGPIAPLLPGMMEHTFDVTTKSDEARQFFNQGLSLIYAFNHAEAVRSFQEAVRLDPECAMAYWGWAYALGPNINRPMPDEDVAEAYDAVQNAVRLKGNASEKEQAFVDALAKRYAAESVADRSGLDKAFSDAMGQVYEKYPNDPDAATVYAASIMELMPWAYWMKDATPRPLTKKAKDILEATTANHPDHPGAHHYYIHMVEEHFPHLAEKSADELIKLVPGSGHLLHMPSHIYMRVGRYADAYESNRRAVLADEGYITACRNQGIYPLSYYPHNIHFLSWAAQREGRQKEAYEAARKVGQKALEAEEVGAGFALHQAFMAFPLQIMTRFGMWDQVLKEPTPDTQFIFARGMHHYARGLANVAKGELRAASKELDNLRKAKETDIAKEEFVGFANATTVLEIAENVLAAELAAARGNENDALLNFERAVRLEDAMMYNEPPDWPVPVRHRLGAFLLDIGRASEAEAVYWTDLKKNPENGYALFGLLQALEAQGKTAEAEAVQERFKQAWAKADFKLTSSRY